MTAGVFLATAGRGISRAERGSGGTWTVVLLLPGQAVACLAADPLAEGVVFAGTQGNGVLRSSDRGITWQTAGLGGEIVKSLAVSPLEKGVVFAGTKPARIFASDDGGESWQERKSFRRIPGRWFWLSPAETPFTAYVQAIALSPIDRNVMLAGIEAGAVVRSADGGETWTGHRKGSLRDCHSLIFHSTDGDWAYEAGGSGGGASVSRDGGQTWRPAGDGLDRHYGWACAARPGDPETWYVSASTSPFQAHGAGDARAFIFRCSKGQTWRKLGGGLPQPLPYMAYALVTDRAAPDDLYTGLANGEVWHSPDQGESWGRLPFQLDGVHRSLITL